MIRRLTTSPDSITESLIIDISRALPGSFVVSRTTTLSYLDHAIGCATHWPRGRNAELIDTLTDGQLWSDVLAAQDEIVAQ